MQWIITAKSFKYYLYFVISYILTIETLTTWLNTLMEWFLLFLSQNITRLFYNTCQSFEIPSLYSDELWWNELKHIHNLTENNFSTDFAFIWSKTWISVLILNNCATYSFNLHGSYIANISSFWRRTGLWKYNIKCHLRGSHVMLLFIA